MVERTSIFVIGFSHKRTKVQLRFGKNINKCSFEKLKLSCKGNTKDKETHKCRWQGALERTVCGWHAFSQRSRGCLLQGKTSLSPSFFPPKLLIYGYRESLSTRK